MKTTIWFACIASMAMSVAVHAEVLVMPKPEAIDSEDQVEMPAGDSEMPVEEEMEPTPAPTQSVSITLPGRGMTKDQVEERFGAPSEKHGPVGEPPISSWVYPGYTVYFEYDHVIHSVHDK